MTTMHDHWGHLIKPTPGQHRRAALRLIEQGIGCGATDSEIREALEMLGCLPYKAATKVRVR